jgi:hypothetical protein
LTHPTDFGRDSSKIAAECATHSWVTMINPYRSPNELEKEIVEKKYKEPLIYWNLLLFSLCVLYIPFIIVIVVQLLGKIFVVKT